VAKYGRELLDFRKLRSEIYDAVKDSIQKLTPISGEKYTLRLDDVDFIDPDTDDRQKEKEAVVLGTTFGRRIAGTWRLIDNKTGKIIDEKRATIAKVPILTNRGVFVLNGNDWALVNQLRLRPGIYVRYDSAGRPSAHINTANKAHRYWFHPTKSVFYLETGYTSVPLITVLKHLGIRDSELIRAWGEDVYRKNLKEDNPVALDRLVRTWKLKNREQLADVFKRMSLDPSVTARTIGIPAARPTPQTMLETTKKILRLHEGKVAPDDRDDLAYQKFVAVPQIFKERIRTARNIIRNAFWRASLRGNVGNISPYILQKHINSVIQGSGLGNLLVEVNPMEVLDQIYRVVRTGKGGIENVHSIPESTRNVQPSFLGFIDPIHTPESGKIGADLRLASGAYIAERGRLLAPFYDKTGKLVWKTPSGVSNAVVAFPGELRSGKSHVAAVRNGEVGIFPREAVDYELAHFGHNFSIATSAVPLKQALFAQRGAMGARALSQALPVISMEEPYVQSRVPGKEESWEEFIGKNYLSVRAPINGTVVKISNNEVVIKDAETGKRIPVKLYHYLPHNRKTAFTHIPRVSLGQQVQKGQILATSNWTNENGVLSLGTNARVAYLPYKGYNYEDAVVISDAFAKRTTSEHLYTYELDTNRAKTNKNLFISVFPGQYKRSFLENYDEDGVIKPGTTVENGQPLVLAVEEAPSRGSRGFLYSDASLFWTKKSPGTVVDVYKTPNSIRVLVSSKHKTEVGDKFCYSEDTEVLTFKGWKRIADVGFEDYIAALNGDTLTYCKPLNKYCYNLKNTTLYKVNNSDIDLFITDNHRVYYRDVTGKDYKLEQIKNIKSDVIFRKGSKGAAIKCNKIIFVASMENMEEFYEIDNDIISLLLAEMVSHDCEIADGKFTIKDVPTEFAGLISSKNNIDYYYSAGLNKTTDLSLFNPAIVKVLSSIEKSGRLPKWFLSYGNVFLFANTLFRRSKSVKVKQSMLNDIQIACIHAGLAVDIIGDSVVLKDEETLVQKEHISTETSKDTFVYCLTVPGHVMLVRRNGKICWCGNSDRFGNKGVISKIVPVEEMPRTKDGQPIDVLLNPLGIISRGNPAQLLEALLGKIAAKTGIPYKIEDFAEDFTKEDFDLAKWVKHELVKNGLSDTEELIDPTTGKTIKDVLVGNKYMLKLHHVAESKATARGYGGYTSEDLPAKIGSGRAKRLGMMELNALLSHGAYNFLRDAKLIRGQRNEDFWRQYLSGYEAPNPDVPLVYKKFLSMLTAAGINPKNKGNRLQILALSNKDIDALTGKRILSNAETVDWRTDRMVPKPGGLFDEKLTGGHQGNFWSAIALAEPMPSPVMEPVILSLLELSEKQFLDILAGKEVLPKTKAKTGPQAIKEALSKLNIDEEIKKAKEIIKTRRAAARDKAIKKLNYLQTIKRENMRPEDWIWNKVPVIPPIFRPISLLDKLPIVEDTNYLYQEIWDANDALNELKGKVSDLAEERLALYKAMKGLVGLSDPIREQNIKKGIKGILKQIFGSSPKYGMLQRKLLGITVDVVGRATITPDPTLDLDEVGLPEDQAWQIYKPFIIRRLIKLGASLPEASKMWEDRTDKAKQMLMEELKYRPLIINRAPTLHKYSIMAFWPVLKPGSVLRVHPAVTSGFGADFDGDKQHAHVIYARLKNSEKQEENQNLGLPSTDEVGILSNIPLTRKELLMYTNLEVPYLEDATFHICDLSEFPHGKYLKTTPNVDGEPIEWYEIPDNIRVLACGKDGKLKWAKPTVWSKHPAREVVIVNLQSGRQIYTDDDPRAVFGIAPDDFKLQTFTPEEALKRGVLVPRIVSSDCATEVDSIDVTSNMENFRTLKLKDNLPVNFDLGYLLGCLIGDGWVAHVDGEPRAVCISGVSNEVQSKLRQIVCTLFKTDAPKAEFQDLKNSYGTSHRITYNSVSFAKFVGPLIGKGADNKHLPPFFLTAPHDFKFGLFCGLIDTDGSIYISKAKAKKKPQLMANYQTNSLRLAREVVILARELGIRARVTASKTPAGKRCWMISFSNYDIFKLRDELNMHLSCLHKIKALNSVEVELTSAQIKTDIIPIDPKTADEFSKRVSYKEQSGLYSAFRRAVKSGYISRHAAEAVVREDDAIYDIVKNTNITWDAVKSTERTGVKEPGYDLTVPGYETFSNWEGVILSNTMQFHVPISDEAVEESANKLLPSKNLYHAANFKVHYMPSMEYLWGIWNATKSPKNQKPRIFENKEAAIAAYRRGELDINTPIQILKKD